MPNYTVTITAEYLITADTPKQAVNAALDRSDHPDQLSIQAAEDA